MRLDKSPKSTYVAGFQACLLEQKEVHFMEYYRSILRLVDRALSSEPDPVLRHPVAISPGKKDGGKRTGSDGRTFRGRGVIDEAFARKARSELELEMIRERCSYDPEEEMNRLLDIKLKFSRRRRRERMRAVAGVRL